jgi:hypothetical protein
MYAIHRQYGFNQPRNIIRSNPYDGETLTDFLQALKGAEVCSGRPP